MLDRTKYNKTKTGLNVLLKEYWNFRNRYEVRLLCKLRLGDSKEFLKSTKHEQLGVVSLKKKLDSKLKLSNPKSCLEHVT